MNPRTVARLRRESARLPRLTLSDTYALAIDPEVVEVVARKYAGTPLARAASMWLSTYKVALGLGCSEDTARRQAAAAWDANRGIA